MLRSLQSLFEPPHRDSSDLWGEPASTSAEDDASEHDGADAACELALYLGSLPEFGLAGYQASADRSGARVTIVHHDRMKGSWRCYGDCFAWYSPTGKAPMTIAPTLAEAARLTMKRVLHQLQMGRRADRAPVRRTV
jgi:hypothetical protein